MKGGILSYVLIVYAIKVPSSTHGEWGLATYLGRARLLPDRRGLVQAPNAPQDQCQRLRADHEYDEETASDSYMNAEPGFQFGPGGSCRRQLDGTRSVIY